MEFHTNIEIMLLLAISVDFFSMIYTYIILKTTYLDSHILLLRDQTIKENKYIKLKTRAKRQPLILLNMFITKPLVGVCGFYITKDFIMLNKGTVYQVLFQLAVLIIISDFCFYFLHFLLHKSAFLYSKIHNLHHRAVRPCPVDYMYEHPLELILENIGVFLGIALLGSVNFITLWLYIILKSLHAVQVHSGISYHVNKPNYIYSGATAHELHHLFKNGNYGFIFTWTDKLFRTELHQSFSRNNIDSKGSDSIDPPGNIDRV